MILNLDKDFSERHGWYVVIAAIVLILPVIFLKPMGPDQATFQSMALELVRWGAPPYLGSWDMNFPGNTFVHALGIVLFGNSDTGFRIVDFVSYAIATIVLYRLALRWVSPLHAAIACTAYVFFYASKSFGALGQRDTFATMLMLVAVYHLLRSTDSDQNAKTILFHIILSGLLIGADITIRPTYAAYEIICLYFIWKRRPEGVRTATIHLLSSAILPVSLLIWYALMPNGLNEFYTATVRFNADIYASRLGGNYAIRMMILNGSLLGAMIYFRYRRKQHNWTPNTAAIHPASQELDFIESYAILTIVLIIIMRKFFRYHYEPVLPIFYLVCSIIVVSVMSRLLRNRNTRYGMFLAPTLAGCVLAITLYAYPWAIANAFVRNLSRGGFQEAQDSAFALSFGDQQELRLTNYVRSLVPATHRLESITMLPGLRWRAERQSATRFTTPQPLVMRTPEGTLTPYQLSWRQEFVQALRRNKPDVIVLDAIPSWFIREFSHNFEGLDRDLPAFDSLLKSDYHFDSVIGESAVYIRTSQLVEGLTK